MIEANGVVRWQCLRLRAHGREIESCQGIVDSFMKKDDDKDTFE
jgi:hypothetical protein